MDGTYVTYSDFTNGARQKKYDVNIFLEFLSLHRTLEKFFLPFERHGRACPGHSRVTYCMKVLDARDERGHDVEGLLFVGRA